jgi:hypothetical protein
VQFLSANGGEVVLTLGEVLDKLYDSEINHAIVAEWDNGFLVRLGDDMNGWLAGTYVRTTAEAAVWLDQKARELCPESKYATGQDPASTPLRRFRHHRRTE